ncbi:MAG: formate--tetrahydrofolate ligase [Desulfitobacteriia bacterium]
MESDIQIAQKSVLKPIAEVAAQIGLEEEDLEYYGKYKAKVNWTVWEKIKENPDGHLILVTAINPTPAGEGKTTTTLGLGQALAKLGKKSIVALREPSLGPCFGLKGGATGGGYAQAVPMEDINLHFTGDFHAVTAAHNLLAAMIDNSIHQGNPLNIDPRQIVFRRVMDMNDRSLRNIVIGLGTKSDGIPRQDGFDITVVSEIMAILCLADNLMDLKQRLARIVVAFTYEGQPVTAGDLKAQGAMALLLKDAIKPNLVQTLENTPVFIHGGPFANIAHGCNSIIATRWALKLADYVITEAGFGADLGAEKFFNLKCRYGQFKPALSVIVVTVKALKYNGGLAREQLEVEDLSSLSQGLKNLEKHIENIKKFGVPAVVAINRFPTDTKAELDLISQRCLDLGVKAVSSKVYSQGGKGGLELAQTVLETLEIAQSHFQVLYELDEPLRKKIEKIGTEIYGAGEVVFTKEAEASLLKYEELGYGQLPVCIAKTQYSLSDDPLKLGRPTNFLLTVRELRLAAGAGFVVAITGDIMTMPGLPKYPAALNMDIDAQGMISGLF